MRSNTNYAMMILTVISLIGIWLENDQLQEYKNIIVESKYIKVSATVMSENGEGIFRKNTDFEYKVNGNVLHGYDREYLILYHTGDVFEVYVDPGNPSNFVIPYWELKSDTRSYIWSHLFMILLCIPFIYYLTQQASHWKRTNPSVPN